MAILRWTLVLIATLVPLLVVGDAHGATTLKGVVLLNQVGGSSVSVI